MSKLKFNNQKIILVLICLIFLFTRFYKINEIPPSVYWDEASIGVNARFIAETGRDEWGKFFPIHFRAFGEFKLPVYIYATAISVKLFGLSEFALRFPAVLFSLGTLIAIYLLGEKISGNSAIGLFGSFFLSISPWFFIFSRTGYEATAGLMFYLFGIYIFLEQGKKSWYILVSIISFILSAYSYNSFRIVSPITFFVLFFWNIRELKNCMKKSIIFWMLSGVVLIVSIIPIYRLYVFDAGISRLQAVGATKANFARNYLSHFNPSFLFISGDKNLRSQQSDFGQLYLPDAILLTLGILYLISKKSRYNLLLLILLSLGPIPAAITKESPHALRAISIVPFICLISANGVFFIKRYFKLKYLAETIVVVIFLIFFGNYYRNFLLVYPVESSEDWQYGYKKIYSDYQGQFAKYDRVLISDEYAQPYIFALFYLKYDSYNYLQTVVRNSIDQWGFSTVSKFGKFEFGKINKLFSSNQKNSLIFASRNEEIRELVPIRTIKFLNGDVAFKVYTQ